MFHVFGQIILSVLIPLFFHTRNSGAIFSKENENKSWKIRIEIRVELEVVTIHFQHVIKSQKTYRDLWNDSYFKFFWTINFGFNLTDSSLFSTSFPGSFHTRPISRSGGWVGKDRRRRLVWTHYATSLRQITQCVQVGWLVAATRRSDKSLRMYWRIFFWKCLPLRQNFVAATSQKKYMFIYMCDLLRLQNSVAAAKIFTKILQYTRGDLSLQNVAATCCYNSCA